MSGLNNNESLSAFVNIDKKIDNLENEGFAHNIVKITEYLEGKTSEEKNAKLISGYLDDFFKGKVENFKEALDQLPETDRVGTIV